MSYRQAWLLLRDAEAMMGSPLIVRATGGSKGGGSKLSDTGRTVIAHYRKIEQSACRAARLDVLALRRLAAGSGAAAQKISIETRPSSMKVIRLEALLYRDIRPDITLAERKRGILWDENKPGRDGHRSGIGNAWPECKPGGRRHINRRNSASAEFGEQRRINAAAE